MEACTDCVFLGSLIDTPDTLSSWAFPPRAFKAAPAGRTDIASILQVMKWRFREGRPGSHSQWPAHPVMAPVHLSVLHSLPTAIILCVCVHLDTLGLEKKNQETIFLLFLYFEIETQMSAEAPWVREGVLYSSLNRE